LIGIADQYFDGGIWSCWSYGSSLKVRDLNIDGLADLLLKFNMRETGVACGETEATLTGETFDGQQFSGTDITGTVGWE
jgi:hypothetical protein